MRTLAIVCVLLAVGGAGCSGCLDDKEKNVGVADPKLPPLRGKRNTIVMPVGAGPAADAGAAPASSSSVQP